MTDDHKADPLDLDALETVARKATPGPWAMTTDGDVYRIEEDEDEIVPTEPVVSTEWLRGAGTRQLRLSESDANHIANFDPPTVLALLAALKEARAGLADAWDEGCVAGRNREHHTNMTREQAEATWPNPYRRTETP